MEINGDEVQHDEDKVDRQSGRLKVWPSSMMISMKPNCWMDINCFNRSFTGDCNKKLLGAAAEDKLEPGQPGHGQLINRTHLTRATMHVHGYSWKNWQREKDHIR